MEDDMPGTQTALSMLNKILGDPLYLRRNKADLLNLFGPDQSVNDMVGMAEQLLEGQGVNNAQSIAKLLRENRPRSSRRSAQSCIATCSVRNRSG
jgi:hypothetical protein